MQIRLLDLAAIDRNLAQLRHRRQSLPELMQISAARSELDATEGEVVELETARSDLDRELRRLEDDVDAVRQRKDRDAQRLSSGLITNPKDLERIEHEIETLKRRQGDLEDQELELMERREEIEGKLSAIVSGRSQFETTIQTATTERDAEWVRIDEQLVDVERDRTAVSADLPADLVALYDKLRASGGVGAAAIAQRRCGGCRLELAGSELGAVRKAAPDDVLRCENCRCIQVRTPESGL